MERATRERRAVRRMLSIVAMLGLVVGVLAFTAGSGSPAHAKVPGTNGQLVFARYDPAIDDSHVFTVNPDGTHEHQLLNVRRRDPPLVT